MKKVLVLGASGYVGSQLLPWLLEKEWQVTAAARQIDYLTARVKSHPNLDLVYLDLADARATKALIQDFDLVFFLVHGMAHGHDFLDYEISLANNFKQALKQSAVKHVIYLSAIQPQTGHSEHLKARRMTGDIIRQAGVPITELRAGVIIGPGSAAFEIMRDFVNNLPLLITPKWVKSKANPIALKNLNHYLLAISGESPTTHRLFEVGGPDTISYAEQFQIIADCSNKPIKLISTRLLTPEMASYWLSLVTSVPSSIGSALLAGLKHDYVANTEEIEHQYPQSLIPFQQMVQETLDQEGEFVKSKVWGFEPAALKRWQPGFGYYAKHTGASIDTSCSCEELWNTVTKIGSREHGYFFANILWRIREWLDLFFGGGVPVRRSPQGEQLQLGDYIDSWKVIRCEKPKALSLLFGMKGPGLGRLEFNIEDHQTHRSLHITAWWHPKGFRGLLYWFAMMPAHLFIFKGMARALVKETQRSS
ncbi:DUF2867 domain-containing protein [Vibrio sonorensis]|uniref:DUF2867 domain-containing protein n=1 Tax=Vibrio sonorensis TaxID=1004316 RepID=UPI0008D9C4C8|nr:DUF2867 domain-containing protein [Vibrio sonorensis]